MQKPSIRILLVDDDATVLINLTAYLEDEGYTVLPATSAESALELLAAGPRPDVVLADVRLPGMDGEELILRAHELEPALRFLIHTGTNQYALPLQLTRIGVREQDVLLKPLPDLGILRDAIERVVTRRGNVD